MRRLLSLIALLPCTAFGQSFTTPPIQLTNGQTARAADVMTDINALISSGNSAFSAIAAQIAGYTPLSVPTGMIVGTTSAGCPAGWHALDGTGGYADYRGLFIRVWNPSGVSGPDFGRTIATVQAHAITDHSHGTAGNFYNGATLGGTYLSAVGSTPFITSWNSGSASSGGVLAATTGSETRPANYSINYCAKT